MDEALVVGVIAISSIVPAQYATLAILVALAIVAARVSSPASLTAWLPTLWLLLLVLGLIGATLGSAATVDIARDLVGMVRFGGLAFFGLVLAREPLFLPRFLRAFVAAGVIGAGHHLYTLATNPVLTVGLRELRTEVGKGSLTEVVALAIVLLWTGPSAKSMGVQRVRLVCALVLSLSILLYFSRTSLMSLLIILVVQASLSSRLRKRGQSAVKYILVALLIGAGFFSIAPSSTVESFAFRAQHSINEILPRDAGSVSLIKRNYRAYESHRAIVAFQDADPVTQGVGYGWGHRIDLLVDTASTTAESARFSAPVLHNGYLFILVKTGLIGLLVYLSILGVFLRGALKSSRRAGDIALLGQVATGCCITTVTGTVVIGGLMNPSTFNGVTLLMALAVGLAHSSPQSGRLAGDG